MVEVGYSRKVYKKKRIRGRLARRLLNPSKAQVVNRLIRKGVKDIIYTGEEISFTYGDVRLHYKVKQRKHLGWVGQWSRKTNTLYYDNDVQPRDRVPLLIHEGIEAYAAKHKHLSPMVDAHYVATKVEDKVVKTLGLNPEEYAWRIEKVYRIEMPKDKRLGSRNKVQQ
jgi:hypothetical protein